ncbi:MAG: phosphatidylglycerol lysyltransferase domain-containing protein [Candidatus Omnitrophica bacterium]|nr:phosphatidylglycerol lysyltransferase domain-containing protein [Candidatus Omnitrophota bacterium]
MKLKILSLQDKGIFNKFLGLNRHELSVYAFENIYIWKGLFDIYWSVIADNLCIFFKDKIGCFLYTSPLSLTKNLQAIRKSFEIMDGFNKNRDISRIENIEETDLPFYESLGYCIRSKSYDYLCKRADLVGLAGDNFKSKRACCNYFTKHYEFRLLPFSPKYRNECLKLYNSWVKEREAKNQDRFYQGMLEDSRVSFKNALDNYQGLNLAGRVVRIEKKIKAFTFGFKLNPDTFCILYEVADLSFKGLAQFIFRRFCSELGGYKYINIMDDSGLDNLKQVKLSYHPVKLIPSYIVTRGNVPRPS